MWVLKIQETRKSVKKVYGFFNNHYHGCAPDLLVFAKDRLVIRHSEKLKDNSNIKTNVVEFVLRLTY